jgi:flagellar basal-body rod protein FlgC
VAEPGGVPPVPRPVRGLLGPLAISASGMARQQQFIEVIARNIANAETTRTAEGGPYRRQVAVAGTDPVTGAPTTTVVADSRPGRMVYEPGHPDADASGYVLHPNVDLPTETVDLMLARRMHEANASVFQAAKAMLRRALDL